MTDATSVRPDTSDMPAVHQVFRSSLKSGPGFVGSAAGDDERRKLIANYYANLMDFLEVHHDGEERIVFPLLIERVPDHRALVERAAAQHTEVVALMTAVRDIMCSWESEGDAVAENVSALLEGP